MQLDLATTEDIARLEGKLDALARSIAGATVTPAPEWVSVAEYMARHGVSKSTVYRQINAGELQARGSGKTREVKV